MKKCPYCAEKIQAKAVVCPRCGRDLRSNGGRAASPLTGAVKKKPFWRRGPMKVILLFAAYIALFNCATLLFWLFVGDSLPVP